MSICNTIIDTHTYPSKYYHWTVDIYLTSPESFPTDTAMIIYGLTKYRDDVILLNEFSLEVKKGDCIGILGAGG